MISQEYIKLLKVLPESKLIEFSKLYYSIIYGSDAASIFNDKWTNVFLLKIVKSGKVFDRIVAIQTTSADVSEFVQKVIPLIAQESNNNKAYRKVDCLCLCNVVDKNLIVDTADLEFGINISLNDLQDVEQKIENNKTLREFLAPAVDKVFEEGSIKFNRKDKILYDLFTTSKKIADIKESFIGSYIQYALYTLGDQSGLELNNNIKTALPNLSVQAFDETIKKSISEGLIEYKNSKYRLTDSYKEKLEDLQAVSAATEKRLLEQFENCLNKYGISSLSKHILDSILELYKLNNTRELANLNHHDENESTEKKLVRNLYGTLSEVGIDNRYASTIIQEILSIVSDSEYLNKMSTTTLFTSLFNSDSLEDFLDTQKRIVYLDTQVLFQMLCVDYQDVPYEDSLYEAGNMLYKQLKESSDYVELYTTPEYIREVSNHLYEAHNLSRFINLDYIRDLGESKNIFYNFYLYLEENENMQFDGYDGYLMQLLNTDMSLPDSYYDFVSKVDSYVIELLNGMGIVVKPVEIYLDLSDIRRDYDNQLGTHPKRNRARDNDIACLYYLTDQSNFIHSETGLPDEPFLLTMDSTLIPLRTCLVKKYQRSYCYIYPPAKFANRLSIMNMKLDSRQINYNIICLAETNFKASNESISLLDVMTMFFKDDVGNKKLPRLLAKMKREELADENLRDFASKNNNNLPIDVALNYIHQHYRKIGWVHLDKVSKIFEEDELSEAICGLLKDSCEYIIKYNREDNSIYSKIDNLIENYIESQTSAGR